MTTVKAAFALVSYTRPDPLGGDRRVYENAFRGQVFEVDDEREFRRLVALGAIVPVDTTLPTPGVLADPTDSPSDEELLTWVAAATPAERQSLIERRPQLTERVEGAFAEVSRRAVTRAGIPLDAPTNDDGVPIDVNTGEPIVAPPIVPPLATPSTEPVAVTIDPETGEVIVPSGAENPDEVGPTWDMTDAEVEAFYDRVVSGNVADVSAWLSDYPGDADAANGVLAAEERRAGRDGNDVRKGVVAAAQAAASATA